MTDPEILYEFNCPYCGYDCMTEEKYFEKCPNCGADMRKDGGT